MKTKITLLVMLFSALNSFAQWQVTSGPNTYGGIYSLAVKDGNIFAGTDTSGIYISADSGASWTVKNAGLTNKNRIIAMAIDGTNLFAAANNSMSGTAVFRTTDNGTIWTATTLQYNFTMSLAAKTGYLIAGTWYGVSYSTNNGTNWTGSTTGLPSNASVASLAFEGSKIFCGVVAVSSGTLGVYRSTNNGSSWSLFNTGLTSTSPYGFAVIGTNAFAGTNGGVFISGTTTAAWSAVNTGLTNTTVKSLYAIGNNLFAGTTDGIFLTVNNGTLWTSVSTGLPANTKVYSITSDGTNLYIGADSMVWKRVLIEMGVVTTAENNSKFSDISVYPNPFSVRTILQTDYQLRNATLTVHNCFGQTVKQIKNISGHTVTLFRDNLPSGLYFLRLTEDSKVITTKKLLITD